MNKIKYSILMPTYNKAEYIKYSIKSILESKYQNFELIISNDYSTDGTAKILSKIKDPRVKIIKPPFRLNHVRNYEFLLKYANGEWITIIGDDDGIIPNFFENVDKYLNKFPQIKAISSKPALYYWKNVEDFYGDRVCDYQNFNEDAKIKNSKITLFLCLLGILNRTDVPMLYTSGIVKRSLIDRIKMISNNFFFHGLLPDYYSSVAILSYTKNFLRINEPLFWVGTSKKSVGRGIKTYESKYNNEKKLSFINPKLKLNKNISPKIHQIGFSPMYFYEALINVPYLKKFWNKKIIKYFVFSATDYAYSKNQFRFKIPITDKEFNSLLYLQIKKENLSIQFYYLFKIIILFLNLISDLIIFIKKIYLYFKKKGSKKYKILVSKDRSQFKNFIICNDYLEKM